MEDFTPSKNFFALFNDAKKIKNIDRMSDIFTELCGEIGLSDPASDQAQASFGKTVAEHMNNLGKGPECKKV
jgi:hypothetical protein